MLFNRDYEVLVAGGSLLQGLVIKPPIRIAFSCDKSVVGGLNKLNIKIYNLNPNHRTLLAKDIETSSYKPIQLKIGYDNKKEIIFKGNIQRGIIQKEGVNFINALECLDGGFAYEKSHISKTITASNVLIPTLLAELTNVTKGFISKQLNLLRPKVLIGNPIDILRNTLDDDEVLYIDNEQLIIKKNKETVSRYIPLVNGASGLLNTPERQQQLTSFETVINPSLRLGGLCNLISRSAPYINGVYQIQTMGYNGDYNGAEWNQKVTAILQSKYSGL